MSKPATLNVTVTYPAAEKPFHQDAAPTETLGQLKEAVLKFFRLHEGSEGGSQITYVFFHGKDKLTVLSLTLGAIAGNAAALSLKLSQQVEQG